MTTITDILIEDDRWQDLDLPSRAESSAVAVMEHLGLASEGYEIAVLACDDARIAVLNQEFRDKPTPTNVLSWPAWDFSADKDGDAPDLPPDPDPHMPEALGDIAIAYETCVREAEETGKPIQDHVTHLIVHGVLHLLGYDHIRDRDATLMERLEVEILGKLGVSDPYMLDTGPDGPPLE